MRKYLQLLFIGLSFVSFKINAQCPNPITFSVNSTAPTCSTCCDGSLTVTNIQNGCPAYNIQITPSATMSTFGTFNNLCSGTYTVKVMDGGCCGSSVMICFLNYSTSPCSTPITYSIQVTPPTCSVCCDGTAKVVNLSGGCSAPYSATWLPSGGSNLISNNLCSGNYSVTVVDSQGGSCCPSVTQGCLVPVGGTTSINENNSDNGVSIFPNPTNSILNIIDKQNQFQNATIEIKNYLGQVVFTSPFNNQIDLSKLLSGVYFIVIKDKKSNSATKFIKN